MSCAKYLVVNRRSFTTYEDLLQKPARIFAALRSLGVPFRTFVQLGNVTGKKSVRSLVLREGVYKAFAKTKDVTQLEKDLVQLGETQEDAEKEAKCMMDAWSWAPGKLEKHGALLNFLGYWGITWFAKDMIVAI